MSSEYRTRPSSRQVPQLARDLHVQGATFPAPVLALLPLDVRFVRTTFAAVAAILTWRSNKRERAVESPQLWTWECRKKLRLPATLAYAFLVSVLVCSLTDRRVALRRVGWHRTGTWSRDIPTPLYRLRTAISRLWLAHLTHMSHPQIRDDSCLCYGNPVCHDQRLFAAVCYGGSSAVDAR